MATVREKEVLVPPRRRLAAAVGLRPSAVKMLARMRRPVAEIVFSVSDRTGQRRELVRRLPVAAVRRNR